MKYDTPCPSDTLFHENAGVVSCMTVSAAGFDSAGAAGTERSYPFENSTASSHMVPLLSSYSHAPLIILSDGVSTPENTRIGMLTGTHVSIGMAGTNDSMSFWLDPLPMSMSHTLARGPRRPVSARIQKCSEVANRTSWPLPSPLLTVCSYTV